MGLIAIEISPNALCSIVGEHTSRPTAGEHLCCALFIANKMLEYKVCSFIHCSWRGLCELISLLVLFCFLFLPSHTCSSSPSCFFPCK